MKPRTIFQILSVFLLCLGWLFIVLLTSGILLNTRSDVSQAAMLLNTGQWQPITTTNAPAGRYGHTALWINNKMLVWGGYFHINNFLNDGHWYDPAIDTWTPISTVNAPIGRARFTAIWTGEEMIVWGGESSGGGVTTNTGGRYNPLTDSWSPISLVDAPSAREMHSAIWTGSEMIIWGGCSTIFCAQIFNDGGRYNPVTDTWTPITSTIEARFLHQAVWSGDKMIIWGGLKDSQGQSYDPSLNTWTPITTTNAPTATFISSAIWTGEEMMVWGGCTTLIPGSSPCNTYVNNGGRYNPTLDTWTPITITNAPTARNAHTAVWTGVEMIIWGGCGDACYNTGGIYNPANDEWVTMATTNAPTARSHHIAVWGSDSMIVWSGCNNNICGNVTYFDTGGQYRLESATTPTATTTITPTVTPTATTTTTPTATTTTTPTATEIPSTLYLPLVLKNYPAIPNTLTITDLVYQGSDEFIEITNDGPGTQLMDGWQIVSVIGPQTFNFPDGIILGVGQTLRVHSGSNAVDNPPTDLLWTTAFIWNNNGDKGELRDDLGQVRDTLCYADGCP